MARENRVQSCWQAGAVAVLLLSSYEPKTDENTNDCDSYRGFLTIFKHFLKNFQNYRLNVHNFHISEVIPPGPGSTPA